MAVSQFIDIKDHQLYSRCQMTLEQEHQIAQTATQTTLV